MNQTTLGEYDPFARKTISYLRARIVYMENLIQNHRSMESMDYNLLRHGFIPYEREVNEQIQKLGREFGFDDRQASFLELTRFGNWFVLHLEKVCGFESISSQSAVPLKIWGDKKKVVNSIKQSILKDKKDWKSESRSKKVKDSPMGSGTHEIPVYASHDNLMQLKLAKAKAKAILRLSAHE